MPCNHCGDTGVITLENSHEAEHYACAACACGRKGTTMGALDRDAIRALRRIFDTSIPREAGLSDREIGITRLALARLDSITPTPAPSETNDEGTPTVTITRATWEAMRGRAYSAASEGTVMIPRATALYCRDVIPPVWQYTDDVQWHREPNPHRDILDAALRAAPDAGEGDGD